MFLLRQMKCVEVSWGYNMPYTLFIKMEKGKKRWCARKSDGSVICYDSREKRERGLKIRERYARDKRRSNG